MSDMLVPADAAILRQPAQKVALFDDALRSLVTRLLLTCQAYHGLGLAAPQIGVSQRVAVVNLQNCVTVLVNPAITKRTGAVLADEECLSLPDVVVKVKRAASIVVVYRDVTGKRMELKATGLLARAIQHEIDHLDGVLITSRGVARTKGGDAA